MRDVSCTCNDHNTFVHSTCVFPCQRWHRHLVMCVYSVVLCVLSVCPLQEITKAAAAAKERELQWEAAVTGLTPTSGGMG